MVLGSPAFGEVYGFLHPSDGSAWLLLRNPSAEPQAVDLGVDYGLGYVPGAIRQVYPFLAGPGRVGDDVGERSTGC